jgi:hypothetical protein
MPRSRKHVLLAALILIATLGDLVYQRSSPDSLTRAHTYALDVLRDVPHPARSNRQLLTFTSRSQDSGCPVIELDAIYFTDVTREQVADFYTHYLMKSPWVLTSLPTPFYSDYIRLESRGTVQPTLFEHILGSFYDQATRKDKLRLRISIATDFTFHAIILNGVPPGEKTAYMVEILYIPSMPAYQRCMQAFRANIDD